MTDRLFELIQRESFRHPFTEVAEEYGYSITTIATIFDDYGAKLEAKRGPVVAPRVLGIDEKHIVNNMRAVFVDGESGCLLEMCEDNKRDTILHTIENMVDYDTNIEIVTMDMACGYRSYIQECLPRATIVVDKFHVYQDFLTKVGTVKTKITERIKSRINAMPEGPEKEHLNAIMKMAQTNNYLFKYGEEKIAEDSSRLSKMANICEAFPEFNHLRLIRTGFERIYASTDRASAEAVCDKWAKLIPPAGQKQITAWEEHFHVDAELFAELRPFRNTITRNWRNEIFNYFNVNCQFTNAVAEGLNCFIERINRQGNGYGFKRLRNSVLARLQLDEKEFVARTVMDINTKLKGAYVFSSGKNMGTFKAVGYPEDVGRFYRLEEYEGYSWTAHGRYPTNTPGWWGGAHPFSLLDWSIVHNGEISSYDANRRCIEMYGYKCNLQTDTEVITYIADYLLRRQGLTLEEMASVIAAPFWSTIRTREPAAARQLTYLRTIYPSLLITGPFSIILGFNGGLMALNDRLKLRSMVTAEKDDKVFIASEEAAIRVMAPDAENLYAPMGGEPFIVNVKEGAY